MKTLASDSSAPSEGGNIRNVAIAGFGTVGSSVARILSQRVHSGIRLTHVYNRSESRKRADWLPSSVRWTNNIDDILSSSEIDILVEVIGGLDPAGTWIRSALSSGKSVVTANKQLIAHHGSSLIDLAVSMNCCIAFGASVAGGIPVIYGLQEGLAGDELFKIYGILNGTCNYILSEIESAGTSFSGALAQAQKLGYAEQDPTDDVDGLDARAKLAILSRVGLNSEVVPDAIACHSIRPIETIDFDYARYLGCTIRQISWAELDGSRLFATVGPALVGQSSPLARVQGSQNLVMSTGRFGGETVFAGHGAGGNPTAVAIVSDIIAIAGSRTRDNHLGENKLSRPPVTSDFTARHYLRFKVKDRPGIIASLSSILARCNINIDSVLQKPGYSKSDLPFVISLEACKFSEVQNAMREMEKLDFLTQPCLHLPVLEQTRSTGAM